MWKIGNVKAVGLAVTSVLKKLSQLLGKTVTVIMRQLSQLSWDSCCFRQKQMRLAGWFQTTGEDIQHLFHGFG